MRMLKITGCSDGHMWYAGKVGQLVPLLRIEHDCYMSREPAGYSNIVRLEDAEIVESNCTNGHKANGEKA